MEAPPTPPLVVAETNLLFEFAITCSIHQRSLAAATTSSRGVCRGRVTNQYPTGSLSPPAIRAAGSVRPQLRRDHAHRIAAKRLVKSGPLPSRHVIHRHAERGSRAASARTENGPS